MSETSIHRAFIAAQAAMGPAIKDTTNPHLKSKYADLGAVQDACFPALHANGFGVRYPMGMTETGVQYVETILAHESGEFFSTRVPLIVGKNDMQGLGSAITYARRYGLMSLAGIAPEDDDGQGAKGNGTTKRDDTPPRDDAKAEADAKHEVAVQTLIGLIESAETLDELQTIWTNSAGTAAVKDRLAANAKDKRKAELSRKPAIDIGGDEIPF